MSVRTPDYVEPFEAWRVWRVDDQAGALRLLSVVQETVWPPRAELVAKCLRRRALARLRAPQRHEPPVEPCACGVYATTLDRLGVYLHELGDPRTRHVFGRVRLWGTVIECEQGWRASHAYPAEIVVPEAPRAQPAGIMSSQRPAAAAPADEIARGLSCYAVPLVVLPHSPVEAVEVIACDYGVSTGAAW